jgi:TIGR03009 family protein
MRYCWPVVAGVVLLCGALAAQQPPQGTSNQSFDPSKDPLDALLAQWEEKMKAVDTISANIVRTRDDAVFKNREIFEGTAQYMKPNFALLDLHMRGQPTRIEKYVSTGTYLFEYAQANRELRFHELPPPKPGQATGDDNFLSFLFGMKADDAKRRYDIKFIGPGQDQFYYYLEITPRSAADRQDFQKASVALTKGTLLPRLLTLDAANGDRTQWDLPKVEVGVRLNRQAFDKPPLPPGWKMVRVARQDPQVDQSPNVPPRVVRPQK